MAGSDFIWRFTPSRTEPEVLEEIFVQRQEMLAEIMERVRESVITGNKHHVLLIGPRGIGKTHLIALLNHRVTRDPALADKVRIAWLLEDETITSFVQFLKRIYESLAEEYPAEFPPDWLEDVLDRPPARILKALETTLICKFQGNTLLLFVENLDLIFEGLGDEGQKQWRAFLQTHPFTTVIATSQRLFKSVRVREQPFFGFFAREHLHPLPATDAVDLLRRIARHRKQPDLVEFLASPEGRSRVRAIHHLAGGNHRIYIVLSGFITRDSLDELVGPFEKMADELTPYYQERMRWLSPQQRQIIEYLCAREGTCTPKEIARHLLTAENTISSQLKKLLELGYVLRNPRGRESLYELAEPLMRLASEVKEKRRKPLRLLVNFLRIWYRPDVLPQLLASAGTPSLRMHIEAAIAECLSTPDPRLGILDAEIKRARQENRLADLLVVLEERAHVNGSAKDWAILAHYHSELRNFNAAADAYDKALEVSPRDVTVWSNKGSTLNNLKRYEEAIRCIDKALEIDPGFAHAWYVKGFALDGLRRHDDAITCYDKALEIGPRNASAWRGKGTALNNLGRHDDAVMSLTRSSEIDPRSVDTWYAKGCALESLGHHDDAITCYDRALEIDPGFAVAWYAKGNVLSSLDRHDDAITCYDNALQANRQDVRVWSNKGSALNNCSRYDEAIGCLDRALEIDPGFAHAWYAKGFALEGLGRYDDAITCHDRALQIDARFAVAWSEKGGVLYKLGRREESIDCLAKALEIDPRDIFAWGRRGSVLHELGRREEAIECYDKALEIDPRSVRSWNSKGSVLHELGRHGEAIGCFEKALEIDPRNAFTWNKKGEVLDRLGRHDAARECYEQVLSLALRDRRWVFESCASRFALRRWAAGFASLRAAFRRYPRDTRHDIEAILHLILTRSEARIIRKHLYEMIIIYEEAGVLAYLGDGLVRGLRCVAPAQVDSTTLENWREAWLESGAGHAELEIPLRIFRVGIEYLIRGDEKVLLDLVTAERRILQQALALDLEQG